MKGCIRLRMIDGEQEDKVWESAAKLRIGRQDTLEIVLNDGSVSRQHAEIYATSHGWRVKDLRSTNGTTLVVTGVFGWKGTVNGEATRQTLALEHFDGSASWAHPFSFMTDGEMVINTKKEASLTLKGMAQDRLAIGDRTTNPLQTSRVTSLGIPLGDLPVGGWQTNVYLDAITGTAQTTAFLDADEEIKIVGFPEGCQHLLTLQFRMSVQTLRQPGHLIRFGRSIPFGRARCRCPDAGLSGRNR